MKKTQYNKLIKDIPKPDVAISIGCNVGCSITDAKMIEDWGLEEPSGKSGAFLRKPFDRLRKRFLI